MNQDFIKIEPMDGSKVQLRKSEISEVCEFDDMYYVYTRHEQCHILNRIDYNRIRAEMGLE